MCMRCSRYRSVLGADSELGRYICVKCELRYVCTAGSCYVRCEPPLFKETALDCDYVEAPRFFVICSVHFIVVGLMTSWVTAWTLIAIQLEQGKMDCDLLLHGILECCKG
jgi:hypothetical protein